MTSSGKIFMSLVMLSIFGVMVAIASQYPAQARFMPYVVGIPGIALCLLQLGLEIRNAFNARKETEDEEDELAEAERKAARITGRRVDFHGSQASGIVAVEAPKNERVRREIAAWAFFLSLIGGILLFGFWITIPIFMALFFRLFAKKSWLFAIVITAVAAAAFYAVASLGLKVVLHEGFIVEAVKEHFGLY